MVTEVPAHVTFNKLNTYTRQLRPICALTTPSQTAAQPIGRAVQGVNVGGNSMLKCSAIAYLIGMALTNMPTTRRHQADAVCESVGA